jgi:anti-sigma factor RsiW
LVCEAEDTVVNSGCQHVREVMDSYLAEELSVETNHEVLRHLGGCPDCAAELKRRQRLRALLSQALDVTTAPEQATARITQALDRERHSWRRVAPFAGIAATLIAAVALAYWMGRPIDAAAYDDSAEDHVACALIIPADTTYDAARAARNLEPPFRALVDAIGVWHGPYQVVDAHMCPYKGRNYAHVVLRGEGQSLSLFAERAGRGALPAAPATPLAGDSVDVHAATRLGYRVSAVATRDYRIYFVSEQPTEPPLIEEEILRAAVRFVRGLEK